MLNCFETTTSKLVTFIQMLKCFHTTTHELLSTVICFVTFCRKTKLNFTTLYRLSIDFFNIGSFESKRKIFVSGYVLVLDQNIGIKNDSGQNFEVYNELTFHCNRIFIIFIKR